MHSQSILVFRKFIPFLEHLEVLIKLENTSKHDGEATFKLFVLVTSTSLESAHLQIPQPWQTYWLIICKSLFTDVSDNLSFTIDRHGWLAEDKQILHLFLPSDI